MSERLRVMALLIPEFPGQTHVAMWRLGRAVGRRGVSVLPVSTRRAVDVADVHPFLVEAAERTFFAWPPRLVWVMRGLPGLLAHGAAAVAYVLRCRESGWAQRLRRLPMIVLAAGLAGWCRTNAVDFLFVHSCGEAAHLAALCRLLGGPAYGLRLGGDLDMYGVDQASKMRDAALIVPAAANNAAEIRDRVGVTADRMLTTWLGVDADRFGRIPRAAPVPGGTVRLLTVARLNFTKGHVYAIRAMRILAERGMDLHYDIVGGGDYRPALEAEARALGLSDRVHFHGSLAEDGVMQALGRAHVFVLPSIYKGEAAPAALIEAMASGLPSVATRIGGTADMVEDGIDGRLVPQEDAEAIAAAVSDLVADPARWRAVGDAARTRAERSFDTAIVAQKLIAAIERRLAHGRAVPSGESEVSKDAA